jgi:phosphoribosylformylglycinamidine synthase subunit PurQ / glutaminase
MAKVKVLVLRAPGTNCDRETAHAFELAGAETTLVHVNRFIRGEAALADYQALVIPGGFTYGDDIAAGKVLANEMVLKLGDDLRDFVAQGKLVMGICNGFQVLVKTGILPGPMEPELPAVTLTTNDSDRFECRWVHLAVNPETSCVFTRGIRRMYLPVAHAEGKLVAAPEVADRLRAVVTYTDADGNPNPGYPANPNGSLGNIAGITDETGCVFALMPHPERYVRRTQHPRWTRGEGSDPGDGLGIFTNAVSWIEKL